MKALVPIACLSAVITLFAVGLSLQHSLPTGPAAVHAAAFTYSASEIDWP